MEIKLLLNVFPKLYEYFLGCPAHWQRRQRLEEEEIKTELMGSNHCLPLVL